MYATLQQFKDYAGITTLPGDPDDQLLTDILAWSEAIIADYLKAPDPEQWTGNLIVTAATLRQALDLYRFRGDDTDTLSGKAVGIPNGWMVAHGYPSGLVVNMLHRLRDPAIA